jgi:hypothetical protein
MTILRYASGIRLAETELEKFRKTIDKKFTIIRPDQDVFSFEFDIDKEKINKSLELGHEKGQAFLLNENDVSIP